MADALMYAILIPKTDTNNPYHPYALRGVKTSLAFCRAGDLFGLFNSGIERRLYFLRVWLDLTHTFVFQQFLVKSVYQ